MRVVGTDFVAGALNVAQDAIGALAQFLAGLGEADATVDAGEQRDAEFVVQPLYLTRQSRLCDTQMRCSAGDAAKLGNADEIEQASQFHRIRLYHRRVPMP